MSAATDSGLVHPTMATTFIERSSVDRLLLDPLTGKSLDVLGFVADSKVSRSDPGCLANLAASGELPSDTIFA